MKNKNFIIVFLILSLVSVFSILCYLPAIRKSKSEARMSSFPKVIGDWKGKDIPVSEREFEILETKNLIMREYAGAGGEIIYLYIVYSEENRKATHPPEICYSGGGATIIKKSIIPITGAIQANKFVIEERDLRQLVVYWFRSANVNTYSYFKQQLKVVTDRMFGKKTSGAMVRISTTINDNDESRALSMIKKFSQQIEPLLPKYVP